MRGRRGIVSLGSCRLRIEGVDVCERSGLVTALAISLKCDYKLRLEPGQGQFILKTNAVDIHSLPK